MTEKLAIGNGPPSPIRKERPRAAESSRRERRRQSGLEDGRQAADCDRPHSLVAIKVGRVRKRIS